MLEEALLEVAHARIGRVVREKWRLDRLLGVGGMASVYAATHRNGMRGALKMLHPELGVRADVRQRFFREGYVANKVEHPGAVRVLDDDTAEDGVAFIVMELLDGENLDARMLRMPSGRLDVAEVLAIADALLDVLAAAHDKGVVHRDLKPENIFMTHQGQLKVLDFGVARVREATSNAQQTATGAVLGTPAFMPPEQARGRIDEIDGRSDLWSAGATLFTLLTGDSVHVADNTSLLLLEAMTKPARSVASLRPDLPPGLAHAIDRALAFERDARWPDARTMRQALRAVSPGPAMAPPAPNPVPFAFAPTAFAPPASPLTGAPSHVSTSFNVGPSASMASAPKKGGGGALIALVITAVFLFGSAVIVGLLVHGSSGQPAPSNAAATATASPSAAATGSPPEPPPTATGAAAAPPTADAASSASAAPVKPRRPKSAAPSTPKRKDHGY